MVAGHPGRVTAHRARRGEGRVLDRAPGSPTDLRASRRPRHHARRRSLHHCRQSRHRADDRDPPRSGLPLADGRAAGRDDVARRAELGQPPRGRHGHDGRRLPLLRRVGDKLVRTLPPLIHLTPEEWDGALVPILCDEALRDHPGQTAVLDRLLDLVVVTALRAWFDRPEADPPSWYRAQADPVVGTAIRLMQNNPAESWTLATRRRRGRRVALRSGAPVQRTRRRAADAVPHVVADRTRRRPPARARHHHRRDRRSVGYSSPFALSTAFKRVRGISPQEHRQLVTA